METEIASEQLVVGMDTSPSETLNSKKTNKKIRMAIKCNHWRKQIESTLEKSLRRKSHRCNQCDYASVWTSNLREHLKSHSGEKPHKCNLCDYSSVHASHVRAHLKIHSGEKSQKCSQCDYSSARASNLRVHLKIHTGKKHINATSVILLPLGPFV